MHLNLNATSSREALCLLADSESIIKCQVELARLAGVVPAVGISLQLRRDTCSWLSWWIRLRSHSGPEWPQTDFSSPLLWPRSNCFMAVWTEQIVLIFPHQILATVMCGYESDFFETRPQFEQTSDPCRTWTSGSPFLISVCREFQRKTHVVVQSRPCHPEILDKTYFTEASHVTGLGSDFTSAHSAAALAPQRALPAILTLLLFIFLLPIIFRRHSPASTAHSL